MLSSPTVNKGAIIDIVSYFTKHKSLCVATTITLYLYNLVMAFVPTNGSQHLAKSGPESERSIFFILKCDAYTDSTAQPHKAAQHHPIATGLGDHPAPPGKGHTRPVGWQPERPCHHQEAPTLRCRPISAQHATDMHTSGTHQDQACAQLGQTRITHCLFIKQKATSCDVAFLNSMHLDYVLNGLI